MDGSLSSVTRALKSVTRSLKEQASDLLNNTTPVEKHLREATSNTNWGCSTTILNEIAAATLDFSKDYFRVMQEVWNGVGSKPKQWRRVLKSLVLLEHLLKHGSLRVLEDCKDHSHRLRVLLDFKFTEEGRDCAAGIRDKTVQILTLINSPDLLKAAREKAREQKGRYIGIGTDGEICSSNCALSGNSSLVSGFDKSSATHGTSLTPWDGSLSNPGWKSRATDAGHAKDLLAQEKERELARREAECLKAQRQRERRLQQTNRDKGTSDLPKALGTKSNNKLTPQKKSILYLSGSSTSVSKDQGGASVNSRSVSSHSPFSNRQQCCHAPRKAKADKYCNGVKTDRKGFQNTLSTPRSSVAKGNRRKDGNRSEATEWKNSENSGSGSLESFFAENEAFWASATRTPSRAARETLFGVSGIQNTRSPKSGNNTFASAMPGSPKAQNLVSAYGCKNVYAKKVGISGGSQSDGFGAFHAASEHMSSYPNVNARDYSPATALDVRSSSMQLFPAAITPVPAGSVRAHKADGNTFSKNNPFASANLTGPAIPLQLHGSSTRLSLGAPGRLHLFQNHNQGNTAKAGGDPFTSFPSASSANANFCAGRRF